MKEHARPRPPRHAGSGSAGTGADAPDTRGPLHPETDCEAAFWDTRTRGLLAGVPDERLRVGPDLADRTIEGLDYLGIARLNRKSLGLLGELTGRRVLDCGCGTGLFSVALAQAGARVVAADLSRDSLRVAGRRADINQVPMHRVCSRLEAMGMKTGTFDAVVGSLVLHHSTRLENAAREVLRVLRPGGRAVFIETSAGNPLLMAARGMIAGRWGIPKASSAGEAPLGASQIGVLQGVAGEEGAAVRVSCPELILFRIGPQYLSPLRRPILMRLCARLDAGVHRFLKPLRRAGYYQVIELRKERPA